MTIAVGILIFLVALVTVSTGQVFGKGCGTIIGFMFIGCLAMLVIIPIMLVAIPILMNVAIPLFLIGGILYLVRCTLNPPGPRPLP